MKTLFVALILAASAFAQKTNVDLPHALTAEQCHADADAWKATAISPTRHETPYKILDAEGDEMNECNWRIDPGGYQTYSNTNYAITEEMWFRMALFLKRHHMFDQFKQEDAEGKR